MQIVLYLSLDDIFEAGDRAKLPVNIALVLCNPDGMLSKTGIPLRITNSLSNSWFLFKSMYSLQITKLRYRITRKRLIAGWQKQAYCEDIGSFKMHCSGLYGWSTNTKCLEFCPAI